MTTEATIDKTFVHEAGRKGKPSCGTKEEGLTILAPRDFFDAQYEPEEGTEACAYCVTGEKVGESVKDAAGDYEITIRLSMSPQTLTQLDNVIAVDEEADSIPAFVQRAVQSRASTIRFQEMGETARMGTITVHSSFREWK